MECIIASRTDNMFDIGDDIALCVATAADRAIEIGIYPGCRGAVIDRVIAAAAIDRIRTRTPDQRIVAALAIEFIVAGAAGDQIIARAAIEHIIAGRAGQRVVAGRTDDMFDIDQRVAFGIAAMARSCAEVDRYRRA